MSPASGDFVVVDITPDADTFAYAADGAVHVVARSEAAEALRAVQRDVGPRWVWWNKGVARRLAEVGVVVDRCWDLSAVHRLLDGGWTADPARIWASHAGLDPASIPGPPTLDLFTHDVDQGDPELPTRPDGHLRHEWPDGAWSLTPGRAAAWIELTAAVHRHQRQRVAGLTDRPGLNLTVRSESAAEVLCAELEYEGLPFDRTVAERIIASFVGPRPRTDVEARRAQQRRDHEVLRHLPADTSFDLRRPDHVKSLLRRVGIEVPDTRAWRLEALRDVHPVVEALLRWRRAERIATTFGYGWIDDHVVTQPSGHDRLIGSWSASDGAAGRMTATAGLHNMPAELRPAIVAEPGHVFVRADLGQIEPRILAGVSGDERLIAATGDDDMYAPVASRLRVEREVAKVAVLGAMYGQTTGQGAEALAGLEREYPIAMAYLNAADRAAQGSNDLRTTGGRLVRMGSTPAGELSDRDARSRSAARGRYGRNAMVQGAAAEFFKTWAVLTRVRTRRLGARIVLCLHDELLVHAPRETAEDTAATVEACLHEAAGRWRPTAGAAGVRFVSDTSIIDDWSQAK